MSENNKKAISSYFWVDFDMIAKKIARSKRYMLSGALKKNGFDKWRLVARGKSSVSGEECSFFFEFYVVNPALSPNDVVLGFKNRFENTSEALQSALAGTETEKLFLAEKNVLPSFVMVKAGKLAKGGKQLNAYFPSSQMVAGTSDFIIKVGGIEGDSCFIKEGSTGGSITVSKSDLMDAPELKGSAGSIAWSLRYTCKDGFFPDYRSKLMNWSCFGAKTAVSGTVIMDGEKFDISKDSSYGYFDKNWGRSFSDPFFHLSSSNLMSNITRKKLMESCFVVQGEYNKRLSVLLALEGKSFDFHAGKHKKYNIVYECIQRPLQEDDEEVRLHWSVSLNDKRHYVDIDIICKTDDMFVREYECPEGGRKVLKLLGGGSGTGDVKVYRMVKRDLELIEDIHVESCVCEFGNIDAQEH